MKLNEKTPLYTLGSEINKLERNKKLEKKNWKKNSKNLKVAGEYPKI